MSEWPFSQFVPGDNVSYFIKVKNNFKALSTGAPVPYLFF
jgi:hypothetical protein